MFNMVPAYTRPNMPWVYNGWWLHVPFPGLDDTAANRATLPLAKALDLQLSQEAQLARRQEKAERSARKAAERSARKERAAVLATQESANAKSSRSLPSRISSALRGSWLWPHRGAAGDVGQVPAAKSARPSAATSSATSATTSATTTGPSSAQTYVPGDARADDLYTEPMPGRTLRLSAETVAEGARIAGLQAKRGQSIRYQLELPADKPALMAALSCGEGAATMSILAPNGRKLGGCSRIGLDNGTSKVCVIDLDGLHAARAGYVIAQIDVTPGARSFRRVQLNVMAVEVAHPVPDWFTTPLTDGDL